MKDDPVIICPMKIIFQKSGSRPKARISRIEIKTAEEHDKLREWAEERIPTLRSKPKSTRCLVFAEIKISGFPFLDQLQNYRFWRSRMEGENSRQGNADNGSGTQSNRRGRSRRDPILLTCKCFSFITSLAAIFCIVINVLSAVRSFRNVSDIFDGIFRCYAVIIAIFVVIAETEWEFFLQFSKVLQYWVGRGMLQIFVAVMTRAYPEYMRNHQELFLLQSIASYMLLACGVIYVISGLLCVGVLKRSRQKKDVSRDQTIKDLEELQRRREELEALLIEADPATHNV